MNKLRRLRFCVMTRQDSALFWLQLEQVSGEQLKRKPGNQIPVVKDESLISPHGLDIGRRFRRTSINW